MSNNDEIFVDDTNANYLEPSSLKIAGTNGKPVKLYRFIGSTSGDNWENVKEYFFYVTPEFVLRNGVTGCQDYGDIGWYCKHKDLFIVEQRLDVPLHLTVGYRERLNRTEAGEWYDIMKNQAEEKADKIKEIKSWFTEAVYPEQVMDYINDIVLTSRVYLPSRRSFFEEGGVCFFIREEQDFIAMFVNLEYSKNLGNCRGGLDGIFCYLDFDAELADLINDWCSDETDDFREMYVHQREGYVYHHEPQYKGYEPPHGHCDKNCGRVTCPFKHKSHSGCTLKKPEWGREKHY